MKNEGREGGKGGFVDQMVMSRDWVLVCTVKMLLSILKVSLLCLLF